MWAPIWAQRLRQMADIDANEIYESISHRLAQTFISLFLHKILVYRTCWLFIAPSATSYACLRFKSIRESRCIRTNVVCACACVCVEEQIYHFTHIFRSRMTSFDTYVACVANGIRCTRNATISNFSWCLFLYTSIPLRMLRYIKRKNERSRRPHELYSQKRGNLSQLQILR